MNTRTHIRPSSFGVILLLAAVACGTDEREAIDRDSRAVVDTQSASSQPDPPHDDRARELQVALGRLVRGDAPRDPGAHSWFSSETADVVRSVSVDSGGHATVDFVDLRQRIPNASASAGSAILIDELNAAVFSVAGIESVDYLMDGSCAAFWEWLQYGCQRVYRDGSTSPRDG